MPSYRKLGLLPPKRHMQLLREGESYQGEGLHCEHVETTQGFDRVYGIMYHRHRPTRVVKTDMAVMFDTDRPLFLTKEAMQLDDPSYPLSWLS